MLLTTLAAFNAAGCVLFIKYFFNVFFLSMFLSFIVGATEKNGKGANVCVWHGVYNSATDFMYIHTLECN